MLELAPEQLHPCKVKTHNRAFVLALLDSFFDGGQLPVFKDDFGQVPGRVWTL